MAFLLAAVAVLQGCGDSPELELPSEGDLDGLYGSRAEVSLNGNVVEVRVEQGRRQLSRGGPLWARVGPYIFLFSPQTQKLFQTYDGVAAVRVRTVTGDGEGVAQATLRRDALNAFTWKDARRHVARARREGTDKPGYMEDLVDYGEERTTHEYNPEFTDGDRGNG